MRSHVKSQEVWWPQPRTFTLAFTDDKGTRIDGIPNLALNLGMWSLRWLLFHKCLDFFQSLLCGLFLLEQEVLVDCKYLGLLDT